MTDTLDHDAGVGAGGLVIKDVVAFGMPGVMAARTGPNAVPQVVLAHNVYYADPDQPIAFGFAPPWMVTLAERVQELSTLRAGWDGSRGRPIEPVALRSAWDLIGNLQPLVRVPPAIVPTSAGGVVLEWHRGPIDLEISISPKGEADVLYESVGEEFEGPLEHWSFDLPIVVSRIV
ncbi:MAG TPA: hypothetical protein VMP41_11450 [Acidimicrobiales bacterium]|nr:hypothetical protein [Acidimicrobiales bacterium]